MRSMTGPAFTFVDGLHYEFRDMRRRLVEQLRHTIPMNRGKWQAEDVSFSDAHSTHELPNVTLCYGIPSDILSAQSLIEPDLPWAEDHFQERVGGKPLNPAPSYVDWPYHSRKEAERHVKDGVFDHTYPERFWPRNAGSYWSSFQLPATGIRFPYGDLTDVVKLLKRDPFTRQAYLPIFFPEDTGGNAQKHAVSQDIRVPCTLGYHFIRRGPFLDCYYSMRSCDIYRHFTNDVYMATRLMHWVIEQLQGEDHYPWPGKLNMTISNLHLFKGDVWRYSQ